MTIDCKAAAIARPGKYLSFVLGGEAYGIEIMKVQEINGQTRATREPRLPEYVRGVVNLRGKVIPVIDLRSKFGMEAIPDTDKTCNIVVQIERKNETLTMGIIVDDFAEVLNITGEQIAPPPACAVGIDSDFIMGMGMVEESVVNLLDIDTVLGSADWASLATVDV